MLPPPESPDPPHSRFLRGGRWSEHFVCYAVTKNVEGRTAVLAVPERAEIILGSLDFSRKADRIRLLAFCVMPDHCHALFFLLPGGKTLSRVMEQIGRYTARLINQSLRRTGRFWQDGFNDHRCRDVDDMNDRLWYIENNPVRAGLVERAEEWPYSSAHPSRAGMLDRQWYSEMR